MFPISGRKFSKVLHFQNQGVDFSNILQVKVLFPFSHQSEKYVWLRIWAVKTWYFEDFSLGSPTVLRRDNFILITTQTWAFSRTQFMAQFCGFLIKGRIGHQKHIMATAAKYKWNNLFTCDRISRINYRHRRPLDCVCSGHTPPVEKFPWKAATCNLSLYLEAGFLGRISRLHTCSHAVFLPGMSSRSNARSHRNYARGYDVAQWQRTRRGQALSGGERREMDGGRFRRFLSRLSDVLWNASRRPMIVYHGKTACHSRWNSFFFPPLPGLPGKTLCIFSHGFQEEFLPTYRERISLPRHPARQVVFCFANCFLFTCKALRSVLLTGRKRRSNLRENTAAKILMNATIPTFPG